MTTATKIEDLGRCSDRSPIGPALLPVEKGAAIGFESLDGEVRVDRLDVTGELPDWLAGSLVRLSPAGLDPGGQAVRHWFDGLAMLHRFGFGEGQVSYANRWLETKARADALDPAQGAPDGFATDPCRSIFKRFSALFSPDGPTDNANVNLTRLGESFIAMTEVPLPVEFDPHTLDTLGGARYADKLGGMVTTAHPHSDPATGDLVNYVVHFGARSEYRVYSQAPGSRTRRLIAAVPVREPSYMHSFAITERYVVLVEFPLVVNPLRLAFGRQSFIESYRWRPDRGTQVTVVDKATGTVASRTECEPLFAFHHVNAFERGSELVIDLAAYDDPQIIDKLFLSELRERPRDLPEVTLRRLTVPATGGGKASTQKRSDTQIELPRIDYRRRNGRDYRFAYGSGAGPGDFLDQLVKIDLGDGSAAVWREEGSYPGEPVFVAAPEGTREDDGVVLSVVLDPATGNSYLLVLDAESFQERARAEAPHAIPFGFHGQFFGGAQ